MLRILLLTAPWLAMLPLPAPVLAQGGGFVFDDPAEPPQAADPEPEPVTGADPEPDPDGLADFTFGGAPKKTRDETPVSPEEAALWQEAETAGTGTAYRRYLELHPDGAFAETARTRLTELQAAEDRRQGLVTACDRMAGDPEDPGLTAGATGMAMEAIDADAALWTCSRALAAAPDLPRLAYNMGRISENQGQTGAALRNYRSALSQAIEQSGAPYLPAAAGILRLSEPRNATERLAHVLLQLTIDSSARLEALQARVAELDQELAVVTAARSNVESRATALAARVEALTAREMELTSALSEAEAGGAREAALAEEVAALNAEVERLTAELVASGAAQDALVLGRNELAAALAAAQAELDRAAGESAAAGAANADLERQLAALSGQIDALRLQVATLTAREAELSTLLEEAEAASGASDALADTLTATKAELEAVRARGEAAEERIRELERKLNAAVGMLSASQRQKAELEEEVARLGAENARLEGERLETGPGD